MGLKYEPSLDGLRAVACLAVVAFHGHVPGFSGGARGVDVFFVLSGYLITSLLLTELRTSGAIDYWAFMRRRLWRLYPALLLLIVAQVAFFGPSDLPNALLAGLYLTDIAAVFGNKAHGFEHTWSLSVEMQFYLLWPLALPVIARTGRPILLLAAAYLAFTLMRGIIPVEAAAHLRPTGLILGAIVALAPACTWRINSVALAAILFAVTLSPSWGGLLPEAATAVFLASRGQDSLAQRALSARPLVWIGLISYGLYLWHFPVAGALVWTHPWQVTFGCSLGAGVVMAAISYYSVERFRPWAGARSVPALTR